MKKSIKHIEEHRKAFEIEVSSEEVKKRKEEMLNKAAKAASIAGFRPGKAPRDLVEKHYGERITKEVVEDLIADSYHRALEEEGIIPLGYPNISDVKLDDASTLSYKAEFNVRPKINLKEYKGLKISSKKTEIKEDDVQKSVKTIQESSAKFKEAQNRAVQIGDYIVCDSEIFVEGKAIAKKRENIWMPIEEKSYVPHLSVKLVGAVANEEREIETVLPEDFQNKECAGKKAIFKIKIKEVKEKVLPKIDDEFAKDLGYNNLLELNESLIKVLKQQAERQERHDLENQVIAKLLEKADFNVPGLLVDEQLRHLVDEEKTRLEKQGLKEDDIKAKEKELGDRLRPAAVKQVKTMFLLDEIAHKEDVQVSQEELDEALEGIARQYNQPRQKIDKYYEENDLISNLRADIRNGKILDLLIKEAEIVNS